MTRSHIDELDRNIALVYEWLDELAAEFGTTDLHAAYRALRGCLHVIRDRLTISEITDLAAQLPLIVRGLFFEGWHPAHGVPRSHSGHDLVEQVADDALLDGEAAAEAVVAAVARLLTRHLSHDERGAMLAALPPHLPTPTLDLNPTAGREPSR